MVWKTLCQGIGFQPLNGSDGLNDLEVLSRDPRPSVILVDVEMPRMDGFELLTALKGPSAHRDIPVVMITLRADEDHHRRALDLGAAAYIVKPYQDKAILELMRHLA